jgi:SAM-dependent methyltransferase
VKESEIRPAELHNEYLRLSALDAERFFVSKERISLFCPACGSAQVEFSFEKNGFSFSECCRCASLYQTPRPPLSEFEQFYGDSPSAHYWANTFFTTVAEARRDKIFRPRVQKIHELCKSVGFEPQTVMDVGAGYGIFLEEWRRLFPNSRVCAVEPGSALAKICREKGIEVLQCLAEQAEAWRQRGDLVTCFEVIEHVHDPLKFITSLYHLAKPGGYVLVSGLGVDGFDIQILWEHAKSVAPPHHINFLSVEGFETLFCRAGFDQVLVTTPGQLDVDIVANTFAEYPISLEQERFVKTLLKRGPQVRTDLQELLAKHKLSSHTWVLARRPISE